LHLSEQQPPALSHASTAVIVIVVVVVVVVECVSTEAPIKNVLFKSATEIQEINKTWKKRKSKSTGGL
jgi:predicted Holliday junction resolvase-like endonuclease